MKAKVAVSDIDPLCGLSGSKRAPSRSACACVAVAREGVSPLVKGEITYTQMSVGLMQFHRPWSATGRGHLQQKVLPLVLCCLGGVALSDATVCEIRL